LVGASGKEFVAKHATITLNSILMAAGKNWRFRWGLATPEEPVCGSDIPRVIHATFHGDVECEAVFVSDENWAALVDDRDTVYTIIGTDTDTEGSPNTKTITTTVKFSQFERVGPPNAEGIVRAFVRGTMTAVPSVA